MTRRKKFNLPQFVEDRKEALLSMDLDKLTRLIQTYKVAIPPDIPIGNNYRFWILIHKTRTGATDLPMVERAASKYVLMTHGFTSMDDGDVLPPLSKGKRDRYDDLIKYFGIQLEGLRDQKSKI